ncbi:MAG TPA: RNase adapter RapZ [Pseudogracilibacillus sp.]|nr:RNase adapter RapZ [Pseudogracilibacillus sp.]
MLADNQTEVLIITGMSGAGKTVAVQSFEDLGYYCVDNLPPTLLPTFLELIKDSTHNIKKIALVIDLRGREFFDALYDGLDALSEADWVQDHMIFLDAKDETLVTRYKETRRAHPLSAEGLPLQGIEQERHILNNLRGRAQQIIDTSNMKPKELREKLQKVYGSEQARTFSVNFVSFGFKYGIPIDADLVFDVRFLPNPFYIEDLRPKTGLDEEVSSYVLKWSETHKFNEKMIDLFEFLIPQYEKEGKQQLIIAIGCTGGQHRSVTLVEHYANLLKEQWNTHRTHRDVDKRKGR